MASSSGGAGRGGTLLARVQSSKDLQAEASIAWVFADMVRSRVSSMRCWFWSVRPVASVVRKSWVMVGRPPPVGTAGLFLVIVVILISMRIRCSLAHLKPVATR